MEEEFTDDVEELYEKVISKKFRDKVKTIKEEYERYIKNMKEIKKQNSKLTAKEKFKMWRKTKNGKEYSRRACKIYYQKHKDELKIYNKQRYQKNREKILLKLKEARLKSEVDKHDN